MSEKIKNHKDTKYESYVSWAGADIDSNALNTVNAALDEYDVINLHQSSAYYSRDNFSNLLPGTSGRPGLTRTDYEIFRPAEAVPRKIKDILVIAERTYQKVGLIRNIIDLMGDFACQGIRLSHTDKRIEKFYRNWFAKVNGKDRSERFLNNLYKTANVIIRRQTAKVTLKDRANLFKTMSSPDIKNIEEEKYKKREIPWRYTFLNPQTIEIIGGNLSAFTNTKIYGIKLPEHIKHAIKNPKTNEIKKMIAELPKEIRDAAKGTGVYMLPPDKTLAFHYKKDDWQDWAIPMTYPIMDDIILLEKLKLADSAALDGAISNIRIFKLGNLEHKILPGPGAAAKLKAVLQNHVGAGTVDIIWGPDIDLLESKTDVHKFLGQEKYIPTLNNIYGGIGIPPTLTGSFSANGTTNNFISLKTLIQRLEYGRDVLVSFWQKEIEIIQKAMGFSEPALVEFDYPDLGDSDSQKALLIQMSDRNLISDELLQEKFKHNTRLENSRIAREDKERQDKKRPSKASPYHEAQPENQLKRIALQTGQLTPEQVGIDFDGTSQELAQLRLSKEKEKQLSGTPQQGRPKTSKDTTKRKTKTFTPRTKASLSIWASEAQEKIAETLNPVILNSFNKKNMRSLTNKEHKIAELIKLGVLFNMEPFTSCSKENIKLAFEKNENIDNEIRKINNIISNISSDLNRSLTLSEIHQIYIEVYKDILH